MDKQAPFAWALTPGAPISSGNTATNRSQSNQSSLGWHTPSSLPADVARVPALGENTDANTEEPYTAVVTVPDRAMATARGVGGGMKSDGAYPAWLSVSFNVDDRLISDDKFRVTDRCFCSTVCVICFVWPTANGLGVGS